jgi:hypothetical protein
MNHHHDNPHVDLRPRALEPLPLGSVRPEGWLRNHLRIQADGLSGHLDEFWPDVARSKWIGGDAEGWERGPYWLDGVVPLAVLLDDDTLKAKVSHWMDHILAHQHEDGWLGPTVDRHEGSGEHVLDPWPLFVLFKAMTQWHEATGDERIIPALRRALRRIDALLDEKPLDSWAKMRWPDLVLGIHWLHERAPEPWLLDLARKVEAQGYDWAAHFGGFAFPEKQPQWLLENHVVNHAMALKEPAVRFRHAADGDDAAGDEAARWMEILDTFHGQATGVFTGDESLAGRNPSQGTELCAVVEYLFSLEVLLAAFARPAFADRWERIAFNALPATFSPDMWAHQYDQQANQVVCARAPEDARIYTNNGPDSNLYGLEPNFGCCTANLHQGWPKFAAHLWMRHADGSGGLTALGYAPCRVEHRVGETPVRITVRTQYPFEERVEIVVSVDGPSGVRFPLALRAPGWADGASLQTPGQVETLPAGTFFTVERDWAPGDTVLRLYLPMPVRAERRFNGAVSISGGPLVYALRIGESWRQVGGEAPHADWEVHPTTPLELRAPDRAGSARRGVAVPSRAGRGSGRFRPKRRPCGPRRRGGVFPAGPFSRLPPGRCRKVPSPRTSRWRS